ncbi:MAG: peptide deformylase [Proteobacteria bacterium]|jgi:peptide deformylase|nr:peptide deformylase [Pseudomonadota bacterium]
MRLDIVNIGNPILRQVATEVAIEQIGSEEVQTFIDNLIETMRFANGAGLAAPQVSVPWRIFVIEVKDNPRYPYKPNIPLTVLINPQIEFLTEERFDNYEGCLSVPNLRGVVQRCPDINIKGYDRIGKPVEISAKGITAGTFQHEYDHLNGILFMDKVKDTKTFCALDEFKKYHEDNFRNQVESIVAKYGS